MNLEDHHRVARARELTYAADVPLRDRYGFAASDEDVLNIVRIVFREPDNSKAAWAIGLGNASGEHEFAMGYDTPTDGAYEMAIVLALRPLVEDRRRAVAKGLE